MVHNVLHNPIGNTIYDDGISRIGSSSNSSGVIRPAVVWLYLRHMHHKMQTNEASQLDSNSKMVQQQGRPSPSRLELQIALNHWTSVQ